MVRSVILPTLVPDHGVTCSSAKKSWCGRYYCPYWCQIMRFRVQDPCHPQQPLGAKAQSRTPRRA
jgi:hypothetical protein